VDVVAVHFGSTSLASTWIDDQEFQYEVWTDDDKTLALHYGAAASTGAFVPDRVTVILDEQGEWLLEYTTGTGVVSHTADVLADCQALFGD
jgi:peroxiredoxin